MSTSQVLIQGSKLPVKLLPFPQTSVQAQTTKVFPGFYSTPVSKFGENGHGIWNPYYGQNKVSPINPSNSG